MHISSPKSGQQGAITSLAPSNVEGRTFGFAWRWLCQETQDSEYRNAATLRALSVERIQIAVSSGVWLCGVAARRLLLPCDVDNHRPLRLAHVVSAENVRLVK